MDYCKLNINQFHRHSVRALGVYANIPEVGEFYAMVSGFLVWCQNNGITNMTTVSNMILAVLEIAIDSAARQEDRESAEKAIQMEKAKRVIVTTLLQAHEEGFWLGQSGAWKLDTSKP
jgi:hypothetical protein